jgi:putative hydrolase of the HAD superfamily
MSLGYIPPVPRLKLPARQGHAWVASAPSSFPPAPRLRRDHAAARRAEAGSRKSADERAGYERGRRGVILDLDDTLYPRERFVMSGFAAVARHLSAVHGVSSEAAYRILNRAHGSGLVGHELQVLCDRLQLSRDLVPTLVDVFRRHMPSLWLNYDVRDALRTLHVAGWRIAILTNGLPSVQFRKIAALGLASLVDEIVYAEEHVAGGKPAAAAFKAALRSLELGAEQCVCVGDDLVRDVLGARALGIRTIRVARPGVTATTREEADMVIDSLRQLPDAASLALETVTAHVA